MEISLISEKSLRIRNKQATIVIDPTAKAGPFQAAIQLSSPDKTNPTFIDGALVIAGPGSYEVGGVKISGTKNDGDTIYTVIMDGMSILLGKLGALDRMHAKIKEHDVVVADADSVVNASFVTNFAPRVVLYFGEQATKISSSKGNTELRKESKYAATFDKLPQEMEEIVLQ